MKIKMNLIFLCTVFFLILVPTTQAGTVNLNAAFYTDSCHYFSYQVGLFELTYHNSSLPEGSQVFLRYGFSQSSSKKEALTWEIEAEKELRKFGDDKHWSLNFSQALLGRGGPHYESLQFVLRIVAPNPDGSQSETWEKGNSSTWGYFQSEPFPQAISCANPEDTASLRLFPLSFYNVVKWNENS